MAGDLGTWSCQGGEGVGPEAFGGVLPHPLDSSTISVKWEMRREWAKPSGLKTPRCAEAPPVCAPEKAHRLQLPQTPSLGFFS